jgi:cytochrome c
MEFSYLQKFGAALLVTVWLVWGSNMIGNLVIPVREPPPSSGTPAAAAAPSAAAQAKDVPIDDVKPMLAAAPLAEGEKLFKKCVACHTAEKGGAAKVGPNLWNVVGDAKAAAGGFSYSEALKKAGGEWTYDDLNHFIANPRAFAPGTKMTFAGLKKTEERAALIAYLRTLADSPPPLP